MIGRIGCMSEFDADKALEVARDSVHGYGFDNPEDKFALTTENVELRTRIDKLEKYIVSREGKTVHTNHIYKLGLGKKYNNIDDEE